MAVFQLLLVLGAPLGHLAWGGHHRRLPGWLRIGSLLAVGIFAFGILCILEQVGCAVLGSPALAEGALWVLAGLFGLSTVGNLASRSPLERRVMTPVALVLAAACVVLAL
jgi:hypothetical protein